jgi:hypothetical protein
MPASATARRFPSQELILDKGQARQKSKTLYAVEGTAAAMHSQKIGNASAPSTPGTPKGDELGPIAVEPYGSVTNQGKAYRQPSQGRLLLPARQLDLKDKKPTTEETSTS